MRRFIVIAGFIFVSGCSDAFTAHVDVVARADDAELTVTRMSELLASARQVPLDRGVVDAIARSWIEFSFVAHRAATGDTLLDSVRVVTSMWPDVHAAVADSFYTVRVANRVDVQPADVDSAYRVGNLRFMAHVLRTVPTDATADEKEAQRLEAERVHQLLVGGTTWDEANQFNQDTVSQPRGGMLGPVVRGATVPRFENVAFALQPGEISEVTETNFGFHIIFRPRLEDIRLDYTEAVRQMLVARVDSAYERELLEGKQVEVRPGAAAAVRESALDPFRARGLGKVIATYEGGQFTVDDLVRWFKMMDPQTMQQLPAAPDEQIVQFVQSLVGQELVMQQADSAGIRLTPELYAAVFDRYARQLGLLRLAMRVYPDSLGDPNATLAERERITDLLVDAYLEAAMTDQLQFIPVPPFLAEQLLEEGDWDIRPAGVTRALERAAQMRAALETDTGQPGGAGNNGA